MTVSATSAHEPGRNRRESFRVNDRVGLVVQPLGESEYRAAREGAHERFRRRRVLNSLLAAAQAERGALRALRDEDPTLGAYLQGLEERFEKLLRLLARDGHPGGGEPSHEVDLSGNGIRFHHREPLAPGSRVCLDLELFPARTCLTLLGTAVRCAECGPAARSARRHLVAIDFTDIHADDRELLIRHVHALQMRGTLRGTRR